MEELIRKAAEVRREPEGLGNVLNISAVSALQMRRINRTASPSVCFKPPCAVTVHYQIHCARFYKRSVAFMGSFIITKSTVTEGAAISV